jgi:hypothetical protein
MPFPISAKSGTMRRSTTNDAPIRLPADTPGTPARFEFIATEISPIDVRKPRIKNAVKKPLLQYRREMRPTASISTSAKNQTMPTDKRRMMICTRVSIRMRIPFPYRLPLYGYRGLHESLSKEYVRYASNPSIIHSYE